MNKNVNTSVCVCARARATLSAALVLVFGSWGYPFWALDIQVCNTVTVCCQSVWFGFLVLSTMGTSCAHTYLSIF